MSSNITLITGGCRSGKSRQALRLAESFLGSRTFIATCPVLDDEMAGRIARHQAEREGMGWHTVEEPLDLARAIRGAEGGFVLVDCLTLWVNNLMHEHGKSGNDFGEDEMIRQCAEVLDAAVDFNGELVFVTNEVGLGIVPENELARRFRDLSGRCNQCFAEAADAVILMVSGQALKVK